MIGLEQKDCVDLSAGQERIVRLSQNRANVRKLFPFCPALDVTDVSGIDLDRVNRALFLRAGRYAR